MSGLPSWSGPSAGRDNRPIPPHCNTDRQLAPPITSRNPQRRTNRKARRLRVGGDVAELPGLAQRPLMLCITERTNRD
ncbi:hypothetical protein INR49_018282 [Caranx melampygus]|nr:hypothetical protein INR49_018282 [Caranx melampygus]